MKKVLLIIFIVIILTAGSYLFRNQIQWLSFKPNGPGSEIGLTKGEVPTPDIEIIADNLNIPWEIAFLPTGEMLVTERVGNLLKIGLDKKIIKIEGVNPVGEGGLQGLVLHPDFKKNNWLYFYLTTQKNQKLINRVERYKLDSNKLTEKKIILDNIPADQYHDGGRIAFGPDRKLYITTGDAGQSKEAQNLNYLGGKILRLNDDGSIPSDNPYGTAVYSYGHRNPQGLAWDESGNLWATEHGRSVPLSGYDELNLIKKGGNYGWPNVQGKQEKEGMISPVIQSGADKTWAPAGTVYLDGQIFFTGLRGESLYQFNIGTKKLTAHFFKEYGRLRALTIGPDGFFYLSTSNRDGRGTVNDGDDKIIKINPKIFK
ncbi:MAG: PQQ-dependent sugar dehydrogenase [Candidatus Buchananbacteria bacterium]|nr:PQQ-dependent sugar dehydrogenase [Candidatus Buchananbacteria bacterium]